MHNGYGYPVQLTGSVPAGMGRAYWRHIPIITL